MKRFLLTLATCAALTIPICAADSEEGFETIFDGKSFNGWKMATENTNSWKIVDGAIVANGNRSHLFYIGDGKPFKDFEFKVDVMTKPNSNGGIYFHTRYQDNDWPRGGFECQVNNSHSDWKKTGSLYDVCNVAVPWSQDNKWWTQHIIVKGNNVTVKVDGKIVLSYTEPPGAQPSKPFERKLNEGTFAFQAHDPGSTIMYKNVRVKRL
ncbi:MAG TPA: DUF1080 domain-containing protein [Verrucomicrobiae bacterium]|nr:DUF1080 domain-containing protein [Verrucomicrobiae bacterium]